MERIKTYVTLADVLSLWLSDSVASRSQTTDLLSSSLAKGGPAHFSKRLLFFLEQAGIDAPPNYPGPFFQEMIHQLKARWKLSQQDVFTYSCKAKDTGEDILQRLKTPSLFSQTPPVAVLLQAHLLPSSFFLNALTAQPATLKKTVFFCSMDTYYKNIKPLYESLCRHLHGIDHQEFLLIEAHYVNEESLQKIITRFCQIHDLSLDPSAMDFLLVNLEPEEYPLIFRILEGLEVYNLQKESKTTPGSETPDLKPQGGRKPLTIQELQTFLPRSGLITAYRYIDAFFLRDTVRCISLKNDLIQHLQSLKRDVIFPLSLSFSRRFFLYRLAQHTPVSLISEEAKKQRVYNPILIKALPFITFSFLQSALEKITQADFACVQKSRDDAKLAFLLLTQLEEMWFS